MKIKRPFPTERSEKVQEREMGEIGNREKYVDLVFEGGGGEGGRPGRAFSVLEERGYEPHSAWPGPRPAPS